MDKIHDSFTTIKKQCEVVKNVKKMKTLEAVKIMDIARTLIPFAMLAAIAILAIRFIRTYMEVCIDEFTIYIQPIFKCAYARKRVIGRIDHERKDAVFTINPDNGRGYPGQS
jgi:hypothetical protein